MALSADEVRMLLQHPEWLTAAGELPLTDASLMKDLTMLRSRADAYARAAVEVVRARRSSSGKLPDYWLMSSESAQQATPLLVAENRACRLSAAGVTTAVDVTCSIGTEVSALTAADVNSFGADVDEARLIMARHNAPDAVYLRADAIRPALIPSPRDCVIVADPARRAAGHRIAKPTDLLPPLPELIETWRGYEMAIKCAPGLDFSDWAGEVALSSVNGSVKEACLYTPGLASNSDDGARVTRSATVIRQHEGVVKQYTLTDVMDDECAVAPAGRFIIDPDGAIIRAGLVRHFAAAHGLWQLDERIAHLTGNSIPAGESGFEIIEQVSLKQVRKALAAHNCGSVEILVRGVDLNPDVLRKQWKLKGTEAKAVVVTRIGKSATAFICQPRVHKSSA